MTACDTHMLFPALEASHGNHQPARAFLESKVGDRAFALCELILMEVYTLLRNPVLCAKPLSAKDALRKIDNLRHNPAWLTFDHPGAGLMNEVWHHPPPYPKSSPAPNRP